MTNTSHPELRGIARRSLGFLAVAVVTSSCAAPAAQVSQGPSDSPTVTASASASATAAPTPSSTPEPTPVPSQSLAFEAPDDILPPGSRVVVLVDELQLRAEPSLAGAVVAVAPAGAEYFVILPGPVVADGLDWNMLLALEGGFSAWAASGSGSDRYLELVPPNCPAADPDLAVLARMLEWDRLSCLGDRSLTIEGTYACDDCGGNAFGVFEPTWLAYPLSEHQLWSDFATREYLLELRVAPGSGTESPEQGSIVRVSGHFNDPASTSCRIETGDPMTIDPRTAELYCRERFVVDAFEVIGTDPDFP
jgi:hypothetical protein